MMYLSTTDEMQPYREALGKAFYVEQVRVCNLLNSITSEISDTDGLEELLALAQQQESISRHMRRALEWWQQGQYREAMRELGWALAKRGG